MERNFLTKKDKNASKTEAFFVAFLNNYFLIDFFQQA